MLVQRGPRILLWVREDFLGLKECSWVLNSCNQTEGKGVKVLLV